MSDGAQRMWVLKNLTHQVSASFLPGFSSFAPILQLCQSKKKHNDDIDRRILDVCNRSAEIKFSVFLLDRYYVLLTAK
jgi:hypothetical protein